MTRRATSTDEKEPAISPLAHGADSAPPLGLHSLLTSWPFEPLVYAALAVAGALYLWGWRRVPAFPRWRVTAFAFGLGACFVALAGPVAAYDTTLFSVHMLQHLLLVSVAGPLLALGAPVALAVRAARPPLRRRTVGVLHSPPLRFLGHPVVTWLLLAAVLWLTHFTGFYNAALESEPLHVVEHALYLTAAFLFWWPVVGADPGAHRLGYPARLAYIVLTMPQQTVVGLAVYSAGRVMYSHYATLQRTWGPSPPADQQLAGQLMWIGGNLLMLAPFVAVVFAWMRYEERQARRVDRRLDRAAAEADAVEEARRPPAP
ncbi:hypothetical protein BH18ACT15_BH18ACT15_06380 [soil metagenome]